MSSPATEFRSLNRNPLMLTLFESTTLNPSIAVPSMRPPLNVNDAASGLLFRRTPLPARPSMSVLVNVNVPRESEISMPLPHPSRTLVRPETAENESRQRLLSARAGDFRPPLLRRNLATPVPHGYSAAL